MLSHSYTDIILNNSIVFSQSFAQGVCSCFSLFNLQGTPCPLADSFHILAHSPRNCQVLFLVFFNFLRKRHCTVSIPIFIWQLWTLAVILFVTLLIFDPKFLRVIYKNFLIPHIFEKNYCFLREYCV